MIIIKENRHVKKGLVLGFRTGPEFCRLGPAFVTREPALVREQRATAAIARPMPRVGSSSYSNFSHLNEQAWAMGDEMSGLGFGRRWELLQTHDNTRVTGDEVLPSCQ
jgi:hypothetical protein